MPGNIASDIDRRGVDNKHILNDCPHPAGKAVYAIGTAELFIEPLRLCSCNRIALIDRRNVPLHCLNLVFAFFDRKTEEVITIGESAQLFEGNFRIGARRCAEVALHIKIELRGRRAFRERRLLRLTCA